MTVESLSKNDPSSFSNPELCEINDMCLHLQVDFDRQVLFGYVDISVLRKDVKAESIILDVRDLNIQSVKNKSTMKNMPHVVGEPIHNIGSKFEIKLPKTGAKKFNIRIEYETTPQSPALQWLDPLQTSGKKRPYLFSQCQAIQARSLVPCQDTPAVKFTYSASITAPADLTVLMSAIRDGDETLPDSQFKVFKFVQKIAIPSYLLAIVVGAIESKKIGPRSHIWCEKELLEKSAYECAEVETMLKTAEEFFGCPYVWEIYDLLILPPSFAYGGMENPCLTFVTPTILAGDRSLIHLIIHEICHSWTGNLVTNKNWEHFWLNEGFTKFAERKIYGKMVGDKYRHLLAIDGWDTLKYTVDTQGHDDPSTKLVVDLKAISPDEAFSSIPYEKGHTFLFHLENLLGGPEIFDPFFKAHIEKFKHQSIDTDDFKSYLCEYFSEKKNVLDSLDWNLWLYTPGMPPEPNFDKTLSNECDQLCQKWVNAEKDDLGNFKKEDIANMKSPQVIGFLSNLLQKKPLSLEKFEKLTEIYNLESSSNSEIRFRWLRLGLVCHWKPIIPHVVTFLSEIGRMKFIEPLYRDLYNWEETRELAISTFKEHGSKLMYMASYRVGEILHLNPKK